MLVVGGTIVSIFKRENPYDPLFWKVENGTDIDEFDDFLDILEKNTTLKKLIYKPDLLDGKQKYQYNLSIEDKYFYNFSFNFTTIRNVVFANCSFEYVKFREAKFVDCQFRNCKFIKCNFLDANFVRVLIDPTSFKECLDKKLHSNIGVKLYQKLLKNYRDEDQPEYERYAQYQFYKWKRYQDWRDISDDKKSPWERFLKFCNWGAKYFLDYFNGFGLKFWRTFRSLLIIILVFSYINFYFKFEFGLCLETYWDSIYFTTISMTTLGYGDITPSQLAGKLFASFQTVVGFLFFGLVASVLFRRVAP